MAGRLIACEGIDGSGKSTVAKRLAAELGVHLTAEPTASWLGEAVRRALRDESVSPWTDALLFMADHATHVEAVARRLDAGGTVVTDRWSESTFAYQGAALAREGFDALAWLRDVERPFDRRPNLVLLFDLPVETAVRRLVARGQPAEKFENTAFLERVRANYVRMSKEDPARWVVLDATRSPDEVLAAALAAVAGRRG